MMMGDMMGQFEMSMGGGSGAGARPGKITSQGFKPGKKGKGRCGVKIGGGAGRKSPPKASGVGAARGMAGGGGGAKARILVSDSDSDSD